MEEKDKAIKTDASTVATKEGVEVIASTEDDSEAKIAALEAEKARLIVDAANYKVAFLKEKRKKENLDTDGDEESGEDMMRRIASETLAQSRIAEIAQEQDVIIKKALKENKELKLARLNNTTTPPATVGTHNESVAVKDTLVTADQLAAFKAKGWSDKDIERYKRNLQKNTR